MDKTYSDLMDIVNRTKKFDSGSTRTVRPRPRPQEVVEENVEEEYVPREYDIEEQEARDKKGSKLFGGALGKLLNEDKPKKSTTKKSTAKSSKSTTKKTTTTKSATKKTPAKKTTTKPKVTKKVEVEKTTEEVKPKKLTPKDSLLNDMDISDPKNAQLYEALKSSLYSGGTDISEYIPEEESSTTNDSLQELRAKREANKINAEITKEQQEYERLFTGSLGLFGEEESQIEEESHTNNQSKVELSTSSDATYELDTGNKDLDVKIAEYYRRKQEKIDQYKKLEEEGLVDDQKAQDVYESKKRAYQDMFGGPLMTRQEVSTENNSLPAEIETVAHASQIAQVETDGKEWTAEQLTQEEKVSEEKVIDRDEHIRSLLSGLLSSRAEKESEKESEETTAEESATEETTQNDDVTMTEDTVSTQEVGTAQGQETIGQPATEENLDQDSVETIESEPIVDGQQVETDSINETESAQVDAPTQVISESVVNANSSINQVSAEKRDELINSVIMGELNSSDNGTTPEVVDAQSVSVESTTPDSVVSLDNSVVADSVDTSSVEIGSEEIKENATSDVINTPEQIGEINNNIVSDANTMSMVDGMENNIVSNEQVETMSYENEQVSERTINQVETPVVEQKNPTVESETQVVESLETVEEEMPEEIVAEDYADLDDEELDRIDRSENEEDFSEYIVSTNAPERSEKISRSLDEYEDIVRNERIYEKNFGDEKEEETPIVNHRDSKTFMMGDVSNSYVDYFDDGEEVINNSTEQLQTKEEKDDSISKEEFYNEMARLQENLINELKGNKVENSTEDYFAERGRASIESDDSKSSSDVMAEKIVGDIVSDYMSNVGDSEESAQEQTVEAEIVSSEAEEPVVESVQEEAKPTVLEEMRDNIKNAEVTNNEVDYVPAEKSEPVLVGEDRFDEFNLLNTEVALNEDDLNYEQEKEESENKEFYLSPEDNEKKALTDDYIDMFSNVKEMGDININKDIANAVPSSEILKQSQETPVEKEPEESDESKVEAIFTLMGIQKKVVKEDDSELKVLYVASECQPFIATGGLADVAGSLPKAIAEEGGIDIRVIMPLYGAIKDNYGDKLEYIGNFTVHLSWRQEYCGLFRYRSEGVTYYFVDNERYFRREKTYGYYDDGERFAYFSKAVVEGLPMLNFFPDIIHCNDWQSALVSTYIKTGNWSDFRYYKIKHIYTIHNVEYQGVYGMENLKDLFGIDNRFRNDMEYNGDINLTKAAIQFSDKFTTVSNSYCDNLKQPYCSRGLHHIIIRNEYKLSGIINGIDYNFYSPATDKCLYKNYDLASMDEKVLNKKIWQEELGLPVDGDTPMISIVSRLVSHKGMDLVNKVIENTLQQDIQLVIVGTGDQRFVDYFKYLESKYPTKVRALVDKYSNELARKAYGASDIFLMPSKIEPCGISQMIASRYGTVPIVREVGGLRDTIRDFGCEGGGNGYTFTNYNPNDLQYTLDRAIRDYQNKPEWKEKMRICMTTDFTWKEPAKKYIDLYNSLKY